MLVSMTSFWTIIQEILDIANPDKLVEIGALRGQLTEMLCHWAKDNNCLIQIIETHPQESLLEVIESFDFAKLLTGTSLERIPETKDINCFIIDGDHNYYTVHNELVSIFANNSPDVIFFHDVGWP